MAQRVVPMLHVPDVRATVEWYQGIGFAAVHAYEDEGEVTFALLSFGGSEIMLSAGGRAPEGDRRDVDLYVRTDAVEADFERLKDRVEIRVGLEDTFYGAREFIVRDPNGFWLTFGQIRAASADSSN